jgi:predicted Ser/Thr protein kinase/poly(3-hydroxybutyrate) depolymerase
MKCPSCQSDVSEDSRFCSKCGSAVHAAAEGAGSFTKTLTTPRPAAISGSLLAGKYRIQEEIGHGGMGVVYRAEDIKLGRPVALKFLPPGWTRDENARERFIREARAAAALAHPNICTVYEVDDSGDQPFIAMEYVEGETLREKTRRGPLPLGEALAVASQAAEGLEAAHRKGIIHRDIKSSNIMVTDKGQAKIMDFGLAKLRGGSSLTGEGATIGTVAYMSPEQARGEKVDHRTDIWSLGVMLYEMLSGELPFRGDRDVSLLYSIVHEEPRSLGDRKPPVTPDIQRVIDRALNKDPGSRYQTAAEMKNDIVKYLDTLKAEAAGIFSAHNLLRSLRRPVVAIPCALGVIAIALLAFWFFNRQAKIRWAREVVIPEAERTVAIRQSGYANQITAYRLAESAEKYIRTDPRLADVLSRCAVDIDVKTDPPGARVFMKAVTEPGRQWQELGLTPIEKTRFPAGYLLLRMEKDGYEPLLAVTGTYDVAPTQKGWIVPYDIFRLLDKKGSLPPGMVRVAGAKTDLGRVDDFFIDKYEVTNEQYKEFINAGGYKDQKYWKHVFTKEGKALTWEEAMVEFVDQTSRPGPSTWRAGDFPPGQESYPVSGVSWYEAAAFAEFSGKSLPTGYHWGIARGEYTPLLNPLGTFSSYISQKSNFRGEGPNAVGTNDDATAFGTYDMAGNVREWCSNETPGGRVVRGGAWNDAAYVFSQWGQSPAFDRSPKNGFRCVLYFDRERIPASAFEPYVPQTVDFYKVVPVPEPVFEVYRNQFSYDKAELNARVENRDERSPDWVQEKISFDAAYGNERMAVYMFLPKGVPPPYQTVVYFPGSGAAETESSQNLADSSGFQSQLSFLIRNRRAVVYPVYKGTFERRSKDSPSPYPFQANSFQAIEARIQQVKDFRRSVDYLETRPDIDIKKLAYMGISWGGRMAPIILAVEDRLRAAVVILGGLEAGSRPEIINSTYIRRVKMPVLMLNGRYDLSRPYETSAKPMFDLLGTPKEDKSQKVYETDHFIPLNELIKETLAWLDKYLGPTK